MGVHAVGACVDRVVDGQHTLEPTLQPAVVVGHVLGAVLPPSRAVRVGDQRECHTVIDRPIERLGDHIVRNGGEPDVEVASVRSDVQRREGLNHEVLGLYVISCREEVIDRLDAAVVRDEPLGGEAVMATCDVGISAALLVTEELGQQWMESVLVGTAFDSRHEDAVRGDHPQDVSAVGLLGDRVADPGLERSQHRHRREEVAPLLALAIQHLLEQELGNRRVRHREALEQVSGFGTVVDGECSQADTGDPPLGASLQRTGQFGCRVDRYGGEQFPRIVEPECEISLPDFGNTALCALAAERNRGIAAADDNRVNRGRKIGEEPTQESPVIRRQKMGIVENHHRRGRLGGIRQQLLDQLGEDPLRIALIHVQDVEEVER